MFSLLIIVVFVWDDVFWGGMEETLFQIPNLFTFAKDERGRFLFCNENLAESAGLDSPHQIVGKTDFELCWKDKADFYRQVDSAIMKENVPYINVVEKQTQPGSVQEILITKSQLLDKTGACIGIAGSYISIEGYMLIKKEGYFDHATGRFYLGERFLNEYLTKRELLVFKYILLGFSFKRIALCLDISSRTVENYVELIKYKLQCKTKCDIIVTAIKAGLTYLLFDAIHESETGII